MNSYTIAVYFKYYLQYKNPKIVYKMSVEKIKAKSFYKKYQKIFTNAYNIFTKYGIDIIGYVKFYINDLNKREEDIKIDFLSYNNIVEYIDHLKIIENYKKIYNYFLKSVKNIAEDAVKLGYFTTKDYFKYLIRNEKISAYYISGKISKYYFASIPRFNKVIERLDYFSRKDLNDIYKKFEKYNADIITAYSYFKSQKVNPLVLTDKLILLLKQKNCKIN